MESVLEHAAYEDRALPIAEGQTISQPFTVAYQTQLMAVKLKMKVLEIGTGSGYQTAILSRLCKEVFSIELIPMLGKLAETILKEEKYNNIKLNANTILLAINTGRLLIKYA